MEAAEQSHSDLGHLLRVIAWDDSEPNQGQSAKMRQKPDL